MWPLTLCFKGSKELGERVRVQGEGGTEKAEAQERVHSAPREREMPGLGKQRASPTRRLCKASDFTQEKVRSP